MQNAARFRWNAKRNIFPLVFLPSDIVLLICEFLSRKDKANLSRVNRYFREILRSPQAWKGTTVCFKSSRNWKVMDRQLGALLEVLAVRRIAFVELAGLDIKLIPCIFKHLPHLEGLSLPKSTSESIGVLQQYVKGNCNLRRLHLGELQLAERGGHRLGSHLCCLFGKLKFLEDVSFGPVNFTQLFSGNPENHKKIAGIKDGLRSALCTSGNLTALAINDCDVIERSWMQDILQKNPQLHTLRLCHVRHITWDTMNIHISPDEGTDGLRARLCPELRTLDLTGTISTHWFFSWFSQHAGKISAITSLNLTNCTNTTALSYLSKFCDVQELDLTKSVVSNFILKKLNFAQLTSLELRACHNVSGNGIMNLPVAVRSTLQYLGLANCENISSHHLLTLPKKFPELKSLDLSCCKVNDEILVDWYLNSHATGQPQLRKLNLTGCEAVTGATVESVRLKTRNCLIVER